MALRPIPMPQPWVPPEFDKFELMALKNLAAGNASSGQQRLALATIIKKIAGLNDMSFRPGLDGARATDFAEGRRFVGSRIMEAIERPMAIAGATEVEDEHASTRRNPKPAGNKRPAKRRPAGEHYTPGG